MARKVLVSLKSILSEAQRRGLVAQNAAQPVRVDMEKRDQRKLAVGRDIPSKEEVQIILSKADGRWRPLLITAIFTGMRASEIRGLGWDDVDFERKVIPVHQRATLWGEIGAPKSAAGEREIPMSPMVVKALTNGGWHALRQSRPRAIKRPVYGSFSRTGQEISRTMRTSRVAAFMPSNSRLGWLRPTPRRRTRTAIRS